MIRSILLAFFLLSFGLSVIKMLDYWDYEQAVPSVSELLDKNVSPDELNQRIGNAINSDDLETAKQYIAIGKKYGYVLDYPYYEEHIVRLDTTTRRIKRDTSHFLDGFISGTGNDTAGLSGAITSDFTVVGDVRDLLKQYKLHQQGQPVNELIVALSGVGIGLTLATVGTGGSSATVKAGTSLFKVGVKSGRVTKSFSKELLQKTAKIFDWRAFKQSIRGSQNVGDVQRAVRGAYHPSAMRSIEGIANQLDNVRRQTSIADTMNMLKYVDNSQDLARLNKFAIKHKKQSAHLMALLGKGAIRTVKVLKRTTEFFLSVFASIVSGLVSLVLMFPSARR